MAADSSLNSMSINGDGWSVYIMGELRPAINVMHLLYFSIVILDDASSSEDCVGDTRQEDEDEDTQDQPTPPWVHPSLISCVQNNDIITFIISVPDQLLMVCGVAFHLLIFKIKSWEVNKMLEISNLYPQVRSFSKVSEHL